MEMEIKYHDGKEFAQVQRAAAWKNRNYKAYLMACTSGETVLGRLSRRTINFVWNIPSYLIFAGFVYLAIRLFS